MQSQLLPPKNSLSTQYNTHNFPDSCLHILCCLYPAGSQESDSSQTAKKDMLAALRARQEALEETLRQRLEELKSICIREAVCEDRFGRIFEKQVLYVSNFISLSISWIVLGVDGKASQGISSGSRRRATYCKTEDWYRLQIGRAENSS